MKQTTKNNKKIKAIIRALNNAYADCEYSNHYEQLGDVEDSDTILTLAVYMGGRVKYCDFVISISVERLTLHNVVAIDGFISSNTIDNIEDDILTMREKLQKRGF